MTLNHMGDTSPGDILRGYDWKDGVYRDLDYVKRNLRDLAMQLAYVDSEEGP